eukprot:TRINITY_DN8088_c0_g1_i1.p2 TRINITY_DN8088_c0_g1~~TRINITY_DN8088_c0_g1_i1.p2  ORF type:complete len:117 (+),score=32.41 TRINITY_DN8088_c0_g1_i1:384-734(+)
MELIPSVKQKARPEEDLFESQGDFGGTIKIGAPVEDDLSDPFCRLKNRSRSLEGQIDWDASIELDPEPPSKVDALKAPRRELKLSFEIESDTIEESDSNKWATRTRKKAKQDSQES